MGNVLFFNRNSETEVTGYKSLISVPGEVAIGQLPKSMCDYARSQLHLKKSLDWNPDQLQKLLQQIRVHSDNSVSIEDFQRWISAFNLSGSIVDYPGNPFTIIQQQKLQTNDGELHSVFSKIKKFVSRIFEEHNKISKIHLTDAWQIENSTDDLANSDCYVWAYFFRRIHYMKKLYLYESEVAAEKGYTLDQRDLFAISVVLQQISESISKWNKNDTEILFKLSALRSDLFYYDNPQFMNPLIVVVREMRVYMMNLMNKYGRDA